MFVEDVSLHLTRMTLLEIFQKHNPDDEHGETSDLNEQQLLDLVEYLKTL